MGRPDAAKQFSEAVKEAEHVKIVFVLEDDDACFQAFVSCCHNISSRAFCIDPTFPNFELPPEG